MSLYKHWNESSIRVVRGLQKLSGNFKKIKGNDDTDYYGSRQ